MSERRVVLITGGNGGIGLGMAQHFYKKGDRVIILDLPEEPSEEASSVVSNSGGGYWKCDITNKEEAESVLGEVVNVIGPVDVLINNAGLLKVHSFIETPEEDLDLMFNVNVKGIYYVTQPIVQSMIDRNQGVIINMASMGGKEGAPGQSAYCASKGAVIELTRVMAMEFGPYNIRVNCLCPGIIETEMGRKNLNDPHEIKAWIKKSKLGRLGTPNDVAKIAYFLSTDDSDYMTGQSVNVTGGMIMH
ncbi:SDR family NAD(P)-dependent oxidoreductase [Metabacillus litoralis]|uniref:SDR family NAD(P)-dependent oxidoreductase n=1 Tax=Metabacillus litoralis TaxID=152268 RepID=UPI00203DE294|nr:SDR family oxidoreductase [Metabacillus litoralis]MCM3655344.1 SDR family oxidoreductase [Metabacillus litoralis]